MYVINLLAAGCRNWEGTWECVWLWGGGVQKEEGWQFYSNWHTDNPAGSRLLPSGDSYAWRQCGY